MVLAYFRWLSLFTVCFGGDCPGDEAVCQTRDLKVKVFIFPQIVVYHC